jgi:hypothetical protein
MWSLASRPFAVRYEHHTGYALIDAMIGLESLRIWWRDVDEETVRSRQPAGYNDRVQD